MWRVFASAKEEWIGADSKRPGSLLGQGCEDRIQVTSHSS